MGSTSRLGGEILISPPLTYQQIKGSPFRSDEDGGNGDEVDLMFVENRIEVEHPDGVHVHIGCGVIVGRWDDRRKYYRVEESLERLSRAYPDNTFRGYLVRSGEEQGDVARYFIDQERRAMPRAGVTVERAEMRWPDGTPVD